jgi:hypothetical protein
MESFLAYLARQYRHKAEDIATDTLAYLLNHCAPAKSAFGSLVAELGYLIPEDYLLESRTRGDKGVPDLLILNSEGLCHGIIENKFWARLTGHQPVGYFDDLDLDGGFVIFIVPTERVKTIREELDRRRVELGLVSVNGLPEWPRKHLVSVISWDRVLAALEKSIQINQPTASSRSTSATEAFMFFYQLRRLCNVASEQRVKPLNSIDLDNRLLGQRVVDYGSLTRSLIDVEEVAEVFKVSPKRKQHESSGPGWSGYFGTLAGRVAWIGFDAGTWSTHGISPIWLLFEKPEDYEPLRKILSQWLADGRVCAIEREDGTWKIAFPILLRTEVEQDEVIESAVSQLRDLYSMLVP